MRALLAPLSELGEYEEIRRLLSRGKFSVALSGCADSQKLHMIYGLGEGFRRKLIVTYNDLRAKEMYEDYRFYDRNVMLYPAKDLIFFSGGYPRQSIDEGADQSLSQTGGGNARDSDYDL